MRDELNRAAEAGQGNLLGGWLDGMDGVYQVQVNNNERFLNNARGGFGRRRRVVDQGEVEGMERKSCNKS